MRKISKNLNIIEDYKKGNIVLDCCESLTNESSILIKNVISKEYCNIAKQYLANVGRCSLPEYHPLDDSTPNHHRVNYGDERASVKGWFHQFNMFMHNQDMINTKDHFRYLFELKDNISTELTGGNIKYDSQVTSKEFISRVGFQFYPKGKGCLDEHQDYTGKNQKVVPTLIMSKRGEDFEKGGFFIENSGTDIEVYADVGDVLIFDPKLKHGVETIDPESEYLLEHQWNFKGRWMAFATTTLKTKRTKKE